MSAPTIYSLGSSTRTPEEFIGVLHAHGIKTLVDVRSFPTSRFEHFKKENLETLLKENAINYVYLGKALGGYRKGGYEAYMETDAYREGLEELGKIARQGPAAFMCAERLPWKCHRRFIGESLKTRGWRVVHIIDAGRVWEPEGRG
ncbi:MAG: DUF488 domain-containing protein [Thermodesulfobacteriota bacterium]